MESEGYFPERRLSKQQRRIRVKQAMSWLIPQMRPLLRGHIASVLFIVLGSSMFMLDPLMIKWFIDVVFPRKDLRLLVLGTVLFFSLYVGRITFNWIGSVINSRTSQKLVFRMRLSLLKHLNELSPEFHESTTLGEKFYRLQQDVEQVSDVGGDFFPYLLRMTFNLVFVVAAMIALNFRLTCLIIPLVPILLVLKTKFRGELRGLSEIANQKLSIAHTFLQEHLGALVQIKLLRRELTQTKLFAHLATDVTRALYRRRTTEIAFGNSCLFVMVFSTVAVLTYGGYQVIEGELTIGGFVAFYSYLGRLLDPMNGAVEIYARLTRIGTSILRLFDVVELKPTVREHATPVILTDTLRGSIRATKITFQYRNRPPLLRGLDLNIEAGEKVALIGASGSGKSTILKLIARLYDVEGGRICIDGTDVRQFQIKSLRRKVVYLPQEPVVFDRSLKENLLLGDLNATDDELQRAIQIAHLDELLTMLDQGWETRLGVRGGRLSVGEKQRLAIARAVLQAPQILLLDESASAVDIPTEKLIFRNLTQHFINDTLIFVSHRVSALEWVDRIVVLDEGEIREQGTHDELMAMNGLYKHLHGEEARVITHKQLTARP